MTEEQSKKMKEEFDAHFCIEEKMMATSKYFDTSLFLQLLKQLKRGLKKAPELRKQVKEVHGQLQAPQTITTAEALTKLIRIFQEHSVVLYYFLDTMIKILHQKHPKNMDPYVVSFPTPAAVVSGTSTPSRSQMSPAAKETTTTNGASFQTPKSDPPEIVVPAAPAIVVAATVPAPTPKPAENIKPTAAPLAPVPAKSSGSFSALNSSATPPVVQKETAPVSTPAAVHKKEVKPATATSASTSPVPVPTRAPPPVRTTTTTPSKSSPATPSKPIEKKTVADSKDIGFSSEDEWEPRKPRASMRSRALTDEDLDDENADEEETKMSEPVNNSRRQLRRSTMISTAVSRQGHFVIDISSDSSEDDKEEKLPAEPSQKASAMNQKQLATPPKPRRSTTPTRPRKRSSESSPISSSDEGSEESRKKSRTTPRNDEVVIKKEKILDHFVDPKTRATWKEAEKKGIIGSADVEMPLVSPTKKKPVILTLPSQWEDLYREQVPVVNLKTPGAHARVRELRFAGTPFIIEGHEGWMKFSDKWVTPHGTLDTSAFLRGLHDVKVPVIEKNYEEYNPIKTYLPLGYYVKNYWEKAQSEYYMHQWQFPLTPRAAKLMCYKCEDLPVVGDNILNYWLDAVRGDNPLQYLFMGHKNTMSRMHCDPGGLDITIAPIVGVKKVIMLHKSAGKLDTSHSMHKSVDFHEIDLNQNPLLAFVPSWEVEVKPGQILYMPEGTFHACENLTPCLSYHRFLVDPMIFPGFLASFLAQDAPEISHAEILWNAVQDILNYLDDNYHANGQELDGDALTIKKLDAFRGLRHVVRAISLEDAVPTESAWDWRKLLGDMDFVLAKVDAPAALNAKRSYKKKMSSSSSSKNPRRSRSGSNSSDKKNATKSTSSSSNSSKNIKIDDKIPTKSTTAPGKKEAASSTKKGPGIYSVHLESATPPGVVEISDEEDEVEEEEDDDDVVQVDQPTGTSVVVPKMKRESINHWEKLQLKVGDIVGVQVFEKRNRAKVLRIEKNMELCQVHYVDWGSIYDEFLPVTSLFQANTRQGKKKIPLKKSPKVHETVLAKWGTSGQLYNAIILKVIKTNACLVHYVKYEKDWDQWILPGHIFKKY